MISFRLLSSALAVLFLSLGATPVHAYVTPDVFINGDGGSSSSPDAPVGDIDNFPLPDLGTPTDETIQDVPLPTLSPLPDVARPNPRARALATPPVAEEPAVSPAWQSAEEERKALRGAHDAAPEVPHTAATPLASSGLPLALPLVLSALWAGSVKLMKRKGEKGRA